MPVGKSLGLDDPQGRPPIEPTGEPDQSHTSRVGAASWLDMTFLVEGELLAQKEDFCRECRAGAQTEEQKAPHITHQRECQTRK